MASLVQSVNLKFMNVLLAKQFIGATLFYVIFLFSQKITFRLFETGLQKFFFV